MIMIEVIAKSYRIYKVFRIISCKKNELNYFRTLSNKRKYLLIVKNKLCNYFLDNYYYVNFYGYSPGKNVSYIII